MTYLIPLVSKDGIIEPQWERPELDLNDFEERRPTPEEYEVIKMLALREEQDELTNARGNGQ